MSHNFQIFGIGKYISGQQAGIDITKIGIQIVRTMFCFIKKQKYKEKAVCLRRN
ncbi:unknown [Prevotella sp. CAG:487]|nr:unknown [Prevotella sp. CAG:487]